MFEIKSKDKTSKLLSKRVKYALKPIRNLPSRKRIATKRIFAGCKWLKYGIFTETATLPTVAFCCTPLFTARRETRFCFV